MNIWITTDTHFGHEQMHSYCGRPEGFEGLILKHLVNTVKQDDILIHLGDFCIGNDNFWHEKFMVDVACKKWLVRGNHDRKSNSWYLSHGWDWVGESYTDTYFGKKILFSHTPLPINESYIWNIHGHFHNTLHRLLEKQWVSPDEEKRNEKDLGNLTPKHKLLSIEYTEYKPVNLKEFIK